MEAQNMWASLDQIEGCSCNLWSGDLLESETDHVAIPQWVSWHLHLLRRFLHCSEFPNGFGEKIPKFRCCRALDWVWCLWMRNCDVHHEGKVIQPWSQGTQAHQGGIISLNVAGISSLVKCWRPTAPHGKHEWEASCRQISKLFHLALKKKDSDPHRAVSITRDSNPPVLAGNLPFSVNISSLPFLLNILPVFETLPSQRKMNVFFF